MNEKILFILLIIVLAAAGYHYWGQPGEAERLEAEESAVMSVIEDFGCSLKNVSLLSPTAAKEIEENYKNFLDPALLAQWQEDPLKAPGRVTSSPWPDRIEVLDIERFGSGSYEVEGEIIEITSAEQEEGKVAARRDIKLSVSDFGDKWLITGAVLGEYIDSDIASQLRDCLPKSDTASRERCQQLLSEINSFDECVAAGFSVMESNPPQCSTPDNRTFIQETDSTWEMALIAIGDCAVEKVFQTHDRVVTLTLENGGKLIAVEPEIDDVLSAVEEAEAVCGNILVGTE